MSAFVPVIYAPGSQVESANLNAIQNKLVLVVNDKLYDIDPSTFEITAGAPIWSGAGGLIMVPNDKVEYTIRTEEHGLWSAISVRHFELVNGEITIKGFTRESTPATTNITDVQVVPTTIITPSATWNTDSAAVAVPEAYDSNKQWVFEIENTGTANAVVHKVFYSMSLD